MRAACFLCPKYSSSFRAVCSLILEYPSPSERRATWSLFPKYSALVPFERLGSCFCNTAVGLSVLCLSNTLAPFERFATCFSISLVAVCPFFFNTLVPFERFCFLLLKNSFVLFLFERFANCFQTLGSLSSGVPASQILYSLSRGLLLFLKRSSPFRAVCSLFPKYSALIRFERFAPCCSNFLVPFERFAPLLFQDSNPFQVVCCPAFLRL